MTERTYLAIVDKDGDERMDYPLTDFERALLDLTEFREELAHDAPYHLARITITTERVTLEGA